jgi:general secretion pathway protein G
MIQFNQILNSPMAKRMKNPFFKKEQGAKQSSFNQKGMTLIEIMIVIAIIAGLMALLAPKFLGQKDKANMGQAKIQMGQIANALAMYKNDCGKFPESLDGLVTADASCTNWGPEAYLKSTPKDPWNNPYSYALENGEYSLLCLGKDGRPGGDGYAKDIPYEQ